MKKQTFKRLTVFVFFMSLSVLLTAASVFGQHGDLTVQFTGQTKEDPERAEQQGNNHSPRISVQPVLNFSDLSVVPAAGSSLARTRPGVFMTFHTSGLTAGTVVTAWWVIFNEPRNCATSPCSVADLPNPDVQSSLVNAAGRIIGADGTATYGDFLKVGDTTGAWTGSGLNDAFKAEIHLVTRTHGPAILGDQTVLAQQLSMFNGGCPPNTCANLQVSIHQP